MPPEPSGKAPGFVQVIKGDTTFSGECLYTKGRLHLNLADVGRGDAKLMSKSTLREARRAVKAMLPDEELYNLGLAVGT